MSSETQTFTEVRARLEEIVGQVRSKELSLEKSLDLFDEAIRLGNNCFELIDRVDFSSEELTASESENHSHDQADAVAVDDVAEDRDEVVLEGNAEL